MNDPNASHSVYIADPDGNRVELLYELPRALWEGDIDAALNCAARLPTEGDAALVDQSENLPSVGPFSGAAASQPE